MRGIENQNILFTRGFTIYVFILYKSRSFYLILNKFILFAV